MINWKEVRREFHKIPELGFEETKTQKLIMFYVSKMKMHYISYEKWETGVIVKVKGKEGDKKIGFRCDIDGLPITEKKELPYKSTHDGKMHACGHDFHITFGLMLLNKLSEKRPLNDYVIVFQPAEEGPGGAEKLIQKKKELFAGVDHFIAFHIDPMMETGVIGYNEKYLFAGAQEIDIEMKSTGGHAAYPEGVTDLAEVYSSLYLANKRKKRKEKNTGGTIVHLGKAIIGEARNSFPSKVEINGTIRAYEKEKIENEIDFIRKELDKSGVEYQLELGPYYHPVINNEIKMNEIKESLEKEITMKRVEPSYTGEDFGFFGTVCPSVMMWIGAKSEYGLHTDQLDPDENVLVTMGKIFGLYIK